MGRKYRSSWLGQVIYSEFWFSIAVLIIVDLCTLGKDATNQLLEDLINVCKEYHLIPQDFSTTGRNSKEDIEETSLKCISNSNVEVRYYQSPTQLMQKQRNELAAQRVATRVKNNIKPIWFYLMGWRWGVVVQPMTKHALGLVGQSMHWHWLFKSDFIISFRLKSSYTNYKINCEHVPVKLSNSIIHNFLCTIYINWHT